MTHQNNPKNTLQIIEWQGFSLEDIKSKVTDVKKAPKIFDELKDFASYDANRYFLSIDKRGKALKAQNYVGLIQTKSGFCLEILPKIYDKNSIDKAEAQKTKDILIEMLKTLRNFPAKSSHLSNLKTSKTSLLEIFVQMFLNELISLVKKGVKSDYHAIEKNRFYLKGKLLFSPHIKHNFAHQERFYTRNDEYSVDIAQNRLIKSTLDLLSKMPLSAKTQNLLQECRFSFDDIPPSKNINKDLASCHNNRSLKYYQSILAWCKIFLKKQNFTSYAGDTLAMAFLFDMNRLFESYITYHLKHNCKDWNIKAQDKSKYLLEGNQCRLIPDIVATHHKTKKIIILDTKWKINKNNIAPDDVYQMWAYLSKYKSEEAILIYPKIGDFQKEVSFIFKPDPKNSLRVVFVDLITQEQAIQKLRDILEEPQK